MRADQWAFAAIEALRQNDIMQGESDGVFAPDRPLTRAELAVLIARWRKLGPAQPTTARPYSDTQAHWASKEIAAVTAAGIANGYEDWQFHPDSPVTRAEMVAMLNRAMKRGPMPAVGTPTWSDVPPTYWAFGDIEEATRIPSANSASAGTR